MSRTFDVLIQGARYFDGTGSQSTCCDIGIRAGRIAEVSSQPIPPAMANTVIHAAGRWVMPGFIDAHTHYDAELIVAPALSESVRHGVTTVLVGSCSLSMVCSDPEDASDLFTRVETVPREKVLPILRKHKTWSSPREWTRFIKKHPLGPNVISYIGHSDLRVAAMGLHRATDRAVEPTEYEQLHMETTLHEALDEGFLGMSTMRLKWDKIDGDRAWSKSLPSTYATQKELGRLNKILRERGAVHQGAPNAANPLLIFEYIAAALGWIRKPLKMTLIALIDLKGNATVRPLSQLLSYLLNLLGSNFRWQLLPTPFTVFADGIDVVFFEEFGAGEMALDLKDHMSRNALLKDKEYRRNFRKFYGERLSPRVWQRDFGDAVILACPDTSLVGRNFSEVALQREIHVVDLFLDLVVEHGTALRWHTTVGNHRMDVLHKLVQDPRTLLTFSDAGAHIRNMAFYNLPLRFLKLVRDAANEGKPLMSMEKAVWRLTGEQADWLGIDAGRICMGDRADLVIINPEKFDQDLEAVYWSEMENFDGLERLVNRNPGLVEHVLINGKMACSGDVISPSLGVEQGYGTFLMAGQRSAMS